MKPVIIYYYRGEIEQLYSSGRCRWIPGYSEDSPTGTVTYPWAGKQECQADAKRHGCRAVFVETDSATIDEVM